MSPVTETVCAQTDVPAGVIDLAHRMAKASTSRFMLGAVIYGDFYAMVRQYGAVGMGYNDMKAQHPLSPTPLKFVHAEFSAALNAAEKIGEVGLKGLNIYVHRIGKDGKVRLAKPCVHCLTMLQGLGIKGIYYSVNKDTVGKL